MTEKTKVVYVVGATRTGKSAAMRQALEVLREQGAEIVVVEALDLPGQELTREFHEMQERIREEVAAAYSVPLDLMRESEAWDGVRRHYGRGRVPGPRNPDIPLEWRGARDGPQPRLDGSRSVDDRAAVPRPTEPWPTEPRGWLGRRVDDLVRFTDELLRRICP